MVNIANFSALSGKNGPVSALQNGWIWGLFHRINLIHCHFLIVQVQISVELIAEKIHGRNNKIEEDVM